MSRESLNFDEGYKEFEINGDENRVIRFNPADYSMIERINQAHKNIDAEAHNVKDIEMNNDGTPVEECEESAIAIKKLNDTIKSQIDFIFNAQVSDIVFGNQSPASMVNGQPLYVGFLDCVLPKVKKYIEEQQKLSEKKISKYTGQIKR